MEVHKSVIDLLNYILQLLAGDNVWQENAEV
jgi:hypothetical protein